MKRIWLKVQACFEEVWEQSNIELQLKGVRGIPPSDILGTAQSVRVVCRKANEEITPEKRKGEWFTRHK